MPERPLDGIDLLPILRGDAPAPSRDLFWSSGSEAGWWAVRSGDWKLVGHRGSVELFDLGRDVGETDDLAERCPSKVAELTALHDAWLAEMADPIRGEAKRYGMEPPTGARKKKKAERTAGRAATDASDAAPVTPTGRRP